MTSKWLVVTALAALFAGTTAWLAGANGANDLLLGGMKLVGIDPGAMSYGVARSAAKTPAPRTVRIVQPSAAPKTSKLTLSGRTVPVEQALISSRASGVVSERHVDIGDRVEAGDILLHIEAPEIAQELLRARAAIGQIEARLKLAKLELERADSLVPKGHVSVQTRDARYAATLSAEADLSAAQAEVQRLEEIISFQDVRAPFAGTIIARQVERGNKVIANQTEQDGYLLRIARLDELRIEIDLPQSFALKVGAGSPAKVSFAELPNEAFTADVVRTAGLIEQASGTMRIELGMKNPNNRIPAGLNGQVVIEVREEDGAVLVPNNTILTRDGRQVVAIVDPENRVRIKPIAVARDLGERVLVSSGLSTEDRVIVSPNALLREGDQVEVPPTKSPGVG